MTSINDREVRETSGKTTIDRLVNGHERLFVIPGFKTKGKASNKISTLYPFVCFKTSKLGTQTVAIIIFHANR